MQSTWITYNIKWEGGRPVSSAASVRYRVIIPVQALLAAGHQATILQLGMGSSLDEVTRSLAGGALVVSKLFTSADTFGRMSGFTLELMRHARAAGMRVLVDISDDHFDDPARGSYFQQAVKECDTVVASTPGLAATVRAHTSRPVRVVSEPYEGPRGAPRFEPPSPRPSGLLAQLSRSLAAGGRRGRPVRVLWFGHESNFESLVALVPDLRALAGRYIIEGCVITSPRPEIVGLCERITADCAPALSLRFAPWSVGAVWPALQECDIVVLPSRADDRVKAVKSPNRLIEAVWGGRFVCASPLPSYREFSAYAWVAEDLVAGIDWALSHRDEVLARIRAGQEHIARLHSPEAIARLWETALAEAAPGCMAGERSS